MEGPCGAGAVVAFGLAVRGTSLAGQYLRLRWRVRQEDAHRRYVEALARVLPPGSTLEESGPGGTTLRLATGAGRERS